MAYPRAVQRAPILFGFVLLLAGCSQAAPAPLAVAKPAPQPAPAPARVVPSSCRATPATVYGDEAVVFDIQAPSAARAEVELFDAGGRSLRRAALTVPGEWRPEQVPSGDFSLEAGPDRVTCQVTVNRELSRASQTMR
jgi:hypothetical protein